jgi:anaerobic selenocysteine-containing dehydrogenase
MGGTTVEKKLVVCSMCDLACTLEAHIEDGRLEKLRGFAEHPLTPDVFCVKPAHAKDWYYNDDRLLYPLKREGERGAGKWIRISWDQAMDEIAHRLSEVVERHGPESFACSTSEYNTQVASGTTRRFMNLLGSPNYISGVSLCMGNTAAVASMTCGGYPFSDYEQTRCVVYFGHNPRPDVWAGEYQRLRAALGRGAKLIVLDPRKSHCAKMAHIHLPLRAGTDAAMSLGWLQVIIEEELYDKEFVSRWCVGFEELERRVGEYPLQRVEAITGVPASLIREAARMYATNSPGVIPWTCITDQQKNSTSALRCQTILRALTGSLNVPGGDVLLAPNPMVVSESELEMHEALPQDKKDLQLGAEKYPVMTYRGQQALNEPRRRVWGLPYFNLMKGQYMAHPPTLFRAMREGTPYAVKAFFSIANNTLMCYTNQKGIYEGLKELDLFVVNDQFMTPTAQLADYVLPGDNFLERPVLYNASEWINLYFAAPKALEPPGECRDVYHFWRELALRMGMEEHFPWKNLEELYDFRVKGTGLTWEELSENLFVVPSPPPWAAPVFPKTLRALSRAGLLPKVTPVFLAMMSLQRRTRERLEQAGMMRMAVLFRDRMTFKPYPHEKLGFATPSGKVELYSSVLEDLGHDPLPYWSDINPPRETADSSEDEYPLQLFIGLREDEYFHSTGRHVDKLRKRNPEPLAFLNTDTARKSDIENGSWIYVETSWGRVKMKAKLSEDMHPDLVRVPHGWWKPEMPKGDPELSGAWDYSDGVLLDDDPAHLDPEQGLPDLRGGRRCRVTLMQEES